MESCTPLDHVISAPGYRLDTVSPDDPQEYDTVSGSSFATPLVAGTAALIRGEWPYLSAAEVVTILLDTADRDFDGYAKTKHGAGVLDAEAALSPQGAMSVPSSADVRAGGDPLATTALFAGPAFGDGFARAAGALDDAIAVDRYARDFRVDLGVTVAAPPAGEWVFAERVGRLGAARHAGRRDGDGYAVSHYQSGNRAELAAIGVLDGWSFTAGGMHARGARPLSWGPPVPLLSAAYTEPATAAEMNHLEAAVSGGAGALGFAPGVHARVARHEHHAVGELPGEEVNAFTAGVHFERRREDGAGALRVVLEQRAGDEGLWGTRTSGAFEHGAESTQAARVEFERRFRGLEFRLGVERAVTHVSGTGTLLDGMEGIESSVGYALGAVPVPGGVAVLGISQPRRVESGEVVLDVPVGVSAAGEVEREVRRVPVSPSGRQVDVELAYLLDVGDRGHAQFHVVRSREPGHVASQPSQTAVGVGLALRY